MRGATRQRPSHWCVVCYFNPRAPCGARPVHDSIIGECRVISIHAPLAGRDDATYPERYNLKRFQSTRPLRGATGILPARTRASMISIHAPLAGRDQLLATAWAISTYFNPRAPCGARPATSCAHCRRAYFNPRAPCGARRFRMMGSRGTCYFNPRAPCGARRHSQSRTGTAPNFNPRAPCGARRGQTR